MVIPSAEALRVASNSFKSSGFSFLMITLAAWAALRTRSNLKKLIIYLLQEIKSALCSKCADDNSKKVEIP